jgi:hypothetical protein
MTTTTNAMNGAVDALEGASYIPENILVTGGAGEFRWVATGYPRGRCTPPSHMHQ